MLTLGDETWLLWLITSAVAISFVALLATCICGCRKTVPKNELMGLAGMVKITNPEESLNHNIGDHLANDRVPCTEIGGGRSCSDSTDQKNRRTSTTANRSLPDIPVDSERVNLDSGDTLWESNEPNGDTCSELYATVEENKMATQPSVSATRASSLRGGGKQPAAGGGATSDDGKGSEHSSLSQTEDGFSPYAQLKSEHPYDQLKKSEHPYAQVGSGTDRNDKSDTLPSSEKTNPVPPPRTRKSNSSNSSLIATQDTVTLPSTSCNIAAATAIAGRISASQELPYMTPPIPTPAMVSDPQLHFSGDSQDSSKGYTSISVREPLANIKAQTRQRSRTQELSDSFYATVSDDSEEMYAAIEEPGPLYTSGSETYAQIQPPVVIAEPVLAHSEPTETQHNPPQPPSVDSLKQVAHVHSRQASSSSAASSVANLGSPKPEKRQANSPLPPPPADLYATVDKKVAKSLEEMYAKVMKKKQRGLSEDSTGTGGPDPVESPDVSSSRESVEGRQRTDSDTNSTGDSEVFARKEPPDPGAVPYADPGYEVVARGEPNYEELPGHASSALSGYETSALSGYETSALPGYASSTLPGYESIGRPRRPRPPPSDSEDPNYEVVRHDDPNYESVDYSDGLARDPPYERLHDSEYEGVDVGV